MESFDPTPLYDSYRSILEIGLEKLRRYSVVESFRYLDIEIDHLHNIPRYLHSRDLNSHAYYFCSERPFYLERVLKIPVINVEFEVSLYQPHWDVIRNVLAPLADTINARQYFERL